MMGFFSKIFEGFLNFFAIIILIAGAIAGGLAAKFIGVIVGILAAFVFEIIFFGVLSQIITIRNFLEMQASNTDEDQRNAAIKELLEKQNNILQEIANKA